MNKRLQLCLAAFSVVLASAFGIWAAKDDIWAVHPGGSSRNTPVVMVPVAGTSFLPGSDNGISLGSSSFRWSDIRALDLTLSDDLTVTDALTVNGNSTLGDAGTDTVTVNGDATFANAATLVYTAASAQALAAGTSISPSAVYLPVSGVGGNVTLTSTPNIATATAVAGQYVIVTSTGNTVTFQDRATLANSGMALSGATLVVSTSTARHFIAENSSNGLVWKEVQ